MQKPTGSSRRGREPEITRKRKQHQADAKASAGERYPAAQTAHACAGGQRKRSQQRAHAGRAHQNSQAAGAAVQNSVGEQRHENGVWHRHQADQTQQKQQGANGRGIAGKTESFDQTGQTPGQQAPAREGRFTRISNRPVITAM